MTVTARAPGDLLTAAIFNTKIEAPLLLTEIPDALLTGPKLAAGAVTADKLASQPAAGASKNATQSTVADTNLTVTWDVEDYDLDTMFAAGQVIMTVKTAGRYLCEATVEFAPSSTGSRAARLYKNGATIVRSTILQAATAGGTSEPTAVPVAAVLNLAVNDTIRILAYQTSGGALNITANCKFTMARIG